MSWRNSASALMTELVLWKKGTLLVGVMKVTK